MVRVATAAACCALFVACGEAPRTNVAPTSPAAPETRPIDDPAAAALAAATLRDLDRIFAGAVRFRASADAPPYLVFVELGDGADEDGVLRHCTAPLLDLQTTFVELFAACGARPVTRPLPAVCFRSRARFADYSAGRGRPAADDVLAYFEWETGRLVLHDACDDATRRHEAAHQLAFELARKPTPFVASEFFPGQSYGFHEGLAEWLAGTRRVPSGAGTRAETGVVDAARTLATFAAVPAAGRFDVAQLLDLTYRSRPLLDGRRQALVYEQGRLLFEFGRTFAVDAGGFVVFDGPGKYAAGFERYVASAFAGRFGSRVFRERLGLDDVGLAALNREFLSYTDWVLRKLGRGQVRNGRLAPWNAGSDAVPARAPRREDDLLVPPASAAPGTETDRK